MFTPFIAGLGPQELVLILLVVVLLFGATKLPELARGSGRALRIFKAETQGLLDDDDETKKDDVATAEVVETPKPVAATPVVPATPVVTPVAKTAEQLEIEQLKAQLEAERAKQAEHTDTAS